MNFRNLYNTLADTYDFRQNNPYTLILRKKENKLVKKFSSGRVIDVGCGTGYHLSADAVGLDISNNMLRIARDKPSLLIQGDANILPVKSSSFNTVTCFYSTLNLLELDKVASEFSRILVSGGRIILSVSSIHDQSEKDKGKEFKNFKIEKQSVVMRLFKKADLVSAFKKSGFSLRFFGSTFRLQKPIWGNFKKLSFWKRLKLKLEIFYKKEGGVVYFFVFEKEHV